MSHSDIPTKTMGRYIFLTNDIGNVGGGQLYLAAKVEWLESIGWDVDVYFFDDNPIQISTLSKFKGNRIRNFEFRFPFLSNKEKESTARYIIGKSTSADRVVIESYSLQMGLWGEYIASKINAKHLLYLLNEHLTVTESQKEFLRFKLRQGLLYGITEYNIPAVLPEADGKKTYLRAIGCASFNAPDIEDARMEQIPADGFTILSIGRLEKDYIPNLFEETVEFARTCPEPVNLVIVGDAPNASLRDHRLSIVKNKPNLRVIFWGYTFPIPRALYERADVFAGTSGSARLAYKEHTPSIVIDPKDHQANGILGETTFHHLYRTANQKPIKISKLFRQVYGQRVERRRERCDLPPITENVDFSTHQVIIDAPFTPDYYDTSKVAEAPVFSFIYGGLKKILGTQGLYLLKKIKHRLKP